MASKAPTAARVTARARRDRAFLKRALADPGLRSKITDASLLPASMRAQRALNVRLNAPIVPGSSTTERELARAAKAETTVRYAPLEAQQAQQLTDAQTFQRNIGDYYDQYLRQVAQHSANVNAQQQQATQAIQGQQQGVTGLAQADLTALGPGAPAQASLANQAAAVRQALVGSFVAQQAAQGAAASDYASGLANIVAPGQRLSAAQATQARVDAARAAQAATARERGAYDVSYRQQQRTAEAKNVLAQQTLAGNLSEQQTQAQQRQQTITETHRANVAREKGQAAARRDARVKAKTSAAAAANKRSQSGPFAGMTQAQIDGMSDATAQAKIDAYNKNKGGRAGKGQQWRTQEQAGAAMTQLTQLKELAHRAQTGLKFEPTGKEKGPGPRLGRHDAAKKILGYATKLKDPVLASAALDAVYDGHLSRETQRRLIAAGFKPSQVASTLGTRTASQQTPRSASNYYGGAGAGGGTR